MVAGSVNGANINIFGFAYVNNEPLIIYGDKNVPDERILKCSKNHKVELEKLGIKFPEPKLKK